MRAHDTGHMKKSDITREQGPAVKCNATAFDEDSFETAGIRNVNTTPESPTTSNESSMSPEGQSSESQAVGKGRSRRCSKATILVAVLIIATGIGLGIYFTVGADSPLRNDDKSLLFNLASEPTPLPSASPSLDPSMLPSEQPSGSPSTLPSFEPSLSPSQVPSDGPTESPSHAPTMTPTTSPSESPTESPTINPSITPTMKPSTSPTKSPTQTPTTSPTSAPTPSPTEAYYPQNPEPSNPYQGYFNYDVNSIHGPNNWHQVDTSGHWLREFTEDGFGAWDGYHPEDLTLNKCNGPDRNQSPKDLIGTIACDAIHEIRTRCSQYELSNDEYMEKIIMPHKLSIWFRRRTCIDNLEDGSPCLDIRPPMADYPRYSAGPLNIESYSDMHHFDIKIPSEHTLEGESYDAELQMFHTSLADPRLSSLGVLIRADSGPPNSEFQVILDEFQAVYDLHAMECATRRLEERKLSSPLSPLLRRGRTHPSFIDYNNETDLDHDQYYVEKKIDEKLAEYHESIRNLTESRKLQSDQNLFNPYSDAFLTTMFFYRYDGSITEPPCRDITWWVMTDPMRISYRQLSQLKRILFSHVDSNCQRTSVHNANQESSRPVYPMGSDRGIQLCGDGSFRSDVDKGRPPAKWCPT